MITIIVEYEKNFVLLAFGLKVVQTMTKSTAYVTRLCSYYAPLS